MASMYGADVQQLTDLANAVDQAANQLTSTRQSVNGKVQQSAWVGPVADKFRSTWSSSGNSQVAAAAQLLSDASTSLRRNAAEQTQASSASGTFGAVSLGGSSGGGGGGGGGGGDIGEGGSWFENIDGGVSSAERAKDLLDFPELYSHGWALFNTSGWSSASAFEDAADWGIAQGPKWIGAVGDFMSTPGIEQAGSVLGVVGAGFAVANAVVTWTDPKSTAWNKTESTVTAALTVGALIPGPQEPFVAAAAGLWVAGTWIYDNHEAIGAWADSAAQNVGNFTQTVAKAEVAGITDAAHVATDAVHKGEQVVGNLSKDVAGFFSGW
jgi:uncharacterized protein YukE